MTDLLTPPTGDYLLNRGQDAEGSDLAQWLSKAEFSRIELGFFTRLLDKAFLRITSRGMEEELKALEKKVRNFTRTELRNVDDELTAYEKKLSEAYQGGVPGAVAALRDTHDKVFRHLQVFDSGLIALKKEIFAIVEHQVKLAREVSDDYQSGHMSL